MEFKAGKVRIDGQPVAKPLEVPDASSVLQISVKQIDRMFEMPTVMGEKISQLKCTFTAYSPRANSLSEVQDGYIKVKLLHGDAHHVVCAYRIPGTVPYRDESYCDDDEFGSGRVLLRWLRQHKIEQAAIYVVHHYGGQKMGPNHFACYTDAAKTAVAVNPSISLPPPISPINSDELPDGEQNDNFAMVVARKSLRRGHKPSVFRGVDSQRKKSMSERRGACQRVFYAARGRGSRALMHERLQNSQQGSDVSDNEWPTIHTVQCMVNRTNEQYR